MHAIGGDSDKCISGHANCVSYDEMHFILRTRTTAVVMAMLLAFGCNEDDSILTASIVGEWTGTLAEIQLKPFGLPLPINKKEDSFATGIEFTDDGRLLVYEDTQPIQGRYELTGDQLALETNYTVEDIALAGTYTVETLTETSLVIFLKRKDQNIDLEGAPAINGTVKITLHFRRD